MTSIRIRSKPSWVWLLLIPSIYASIYLYQRQYAAENLPRIRAGLAEAQKVGPGMLDEIGAPPGATVFSPLETKVLTAGRRSFWRNTQVAAAWQTTWDIPGDHPAMLAWYHERLTAKGWTLYTPQVPSELETIYCKDQWRVTLGHNVTFATDHPPHARIQFELRWDYFQKPPPPPSNSNK
jgi:hypothetical protein